MQDENRWKYAARQAGMTLSEWARTTLEAAAAASQAAEESADLELDPIERHIAESPLSDVVSRVTPVRILTASDERFIESWRASSSAADVATHLGMPSGHAASMRAASLRKAGVQLPMMRRGPRAPRALGRAQGVITLETFEHARARIDEINAEIAHT